MNEGQLLPLDDDEESPFIVQGALKGTHLIEPDPDILYDLYHLTSGDEPE